jgi:cytoskeletal protein RodZ
MSRTTHPSVRIGLVVILIASVAATPTYLFAQQSQGIQDSSQPPTSSSSSQTSTSTSPDLPDAPQPGQTQSSSSASQEKSQAPAGAAAAKAPRVQGAPASEPVGAAIAPVKQSQRRSLWIKVGLVAGAGIALGTALALSKSSPSRPPGAQAASNHP